MEIHEERVKITFQVTLRKRIRSGLPKCPFEESSSSSSSTFHTLINMPMLPYNQSFILSFVCCCYFILCELDVEKEKKVKRKGSHFTVGEGG